MATYGTETVPSTWDDDRDTAFFRLTAQLFTSEFTYGAGVLLASYDDECATTEAQPAVPSHLPCTRTMIVSMY